MGEQGPSSASAGVGMMALRMRAEDSGTVEEDTKAGAEPGSTEEAKDQTAEKVEGSKEDARAEEGNYIEGFGCNGGLMTSGHGQHHPQRL